MLVQEFLENPNDLTKAFLRITTGIPWNVKANFNMRREENQTIFTVNGKDIGSYERTTVQECEPVRMMMEARGDTILHDDTIEIYCRGRVTAFLVNDDYIGREVTQKQEVKCYCLSCGKPMDLNKNFYCDGCFKPEKAVDFSHSKATQKALARAKEEINATEKNKENSSAKVR